MRKYILFIVGIRDSYAGAKIDFASEMGADVSCCSTERRMMSSESIVRLAYVPSGVGGGGDWAALGGPDLSACCSVERDVPGNLRSSSSIKLASEPARSSFAEPAGTRKGRPADDGTVPVAAAQLTSAPRRKRAALPAQALIKLEELEKRIEAIKKEQADLKAKRERDWKQKWQQADNLRVSLIEECAEAKREPEVRRAMRPVKFDSFTCRQLQRSSSKSWHQALIAGSANG